MRVRPGPRQLHHRDDAMRHVAVHFRGAVCGIGQRRVVAAASWDVLRTGKSVHLAVGCCLGDD